MMVTLVSQCEKKALNRTRRVLDAFANRIGDNTWQTVITQEGLLAVKKLLRKTASKNTAVSCHWIRSRSRSELVWVVGSRGKFNEGGVVPVNFTKKNILNSNIENDWHYLPLIKAITGVAALFHDWGKASKLFQEKLSPKSKNKYKGDPIRHEWISCVLLNSLVQHTGSDSDDGWLNCLASGELDETTLMALAMKRPERPLQQLPPAAKLVAWLILSHHRLPLPNDVWKGESSKTLDSLLKRVTYKWGYENFYDEKEYQKRIRACFEFPNGLLSESGKWLKQIKKWSQRLQSCQSLVVSTINDDSYRLVLHHSRLCLMLADHYYSSLDAEENWQDEIGLFANTYRKTKDHKEGYKQKLDEHLIGVCKNALHTAHLLPAFEKEPPVCRDVRELKKPSPKKYGWQDKAVRGIMKWKKQQVQKNQGFFAVNMASTGCGKTFANAKVMQALSVDGKSLRYILALGLRTLTLQTGDEYRERIFHQGDGSEFAVLIGSKAVLDLHHHKQSFNDEAEENFSGSESEQSLLDEDIEYDCDIPQKGLTTVLTKQKDRQFLYAPVLACTIDHLMSATETKRGGRYILPSLRLMSSDVVIDEVDDFTDSDIIAIGRLIHLIGMLGRKVMISSATIPPDLAEGYFNAYKKGWQLFSKTRDEAESSIGCAWIDEFQTQTCTIQSECSKQAIEKYTNRHNEFVGSRINSLKTQTVKRKAHVIPCAIDENNAEESRQDLYFSHIHQAILDKHMLHNTTDKKTTINVSFGVVRVANIKPCIELTQYLLRSACPPGIEIKTMAYHSQQVLLLRHIQEAHLDEVLKRKEDKGQEPKSFRHPLIRQHLDNSNAKQLIFVLVATPVEEVGRDHDFDWAIVEPSSFRSIIQLAGRVRRHRMNEVDAPNVGLMQYNWKAFKDNDKPDQKYFNRPGYEISTSLKTHDLNQLIPVNEVVQCLDATPRIKKNECLKENESLIDLEHFMIQLGLTRYQKIGPENIQGYLTGSWGLTAYPQELHPFRKSQKSINTFLTYDEDKGCFYFAEKDNFGNPVNTETILGISRKNITAEEQNNLWMVRNYQDLIEQYAVQYKTSKKRMSLRFGELSFIERDDAKYEYNDQFGLVKI
ncbi:MAG: type I-F CRISPR-associated helicase Cas3 [Colwellia sp.]|nr:type I-F CRISPR-associated helicase Cas3 [Colwellia sp.]